MALKMFFGEITLEEFILFAARAHDDDLLHKVSRSLCAQILIDVN